MTFKRSTPITALDLDPSDLPDPSSSSKGGVKLGVYPTDVAEPLAVPNLATAQTMATGCAVAMALIFGGS
jgi:hypothetical protein